MTTIPHARRHFHFHFHLHRLLPLGLLAAAATAAFADSLPGPKTRPADPNDPAELLKSAGDAMAATRPAKPATRPATTPAEVTTDARKELDAIRDAYRSLTTLRLAGTISSDIEVGGEARKDRATFEASFSGKSEAMGKFRHASRDAAEGSTPGREDVVVGSSGQKLYVHQPSRRFYRSADAPTTRPTGAELGEDVNALLAGQNPSLLLAVVNDAAAEVLEGATKAEKGPDIRIGESGFPALKATMPKGVEMTIAVDPATHLLRQVTTSLAGSLREQGQPDVSRVLITVDYTTVEPGPAIADDQFAWAAPLGAKDVTNRANSRALAGAAGSPEAAVAALEGKPAPDFTLKGMDGKDVKLSALKGSVVLLDFWATWCGPCVESMPKLNKLYEGKKGSGLKAFAVNAKEEKEDVEAFVKETSLTIPVLLDSEGKVYEQYKLPGLPVTMVVDKEGVVKRAVLGARPKDHEAIENAVEEALK